MVQMNELTAGGRGQTAYQGVPNGTDRKWSPLRPARDPLLVRWRLPVGLPSGPGCSSISQRSRVRGPAWYGVGMPGPLLAVALVAYNNLASLLFDRSDAWYVISNLVTAGVLLLLARRPFGLGPTSIGLRGNDLSFVRSTAVLATLVMTPVFMLALLPATAPLLTDERVAGLGGGSLVFYALVRIPVGTAFFEELAFRGVLFGAFASRGTVRAAVATSVAFGLWHVGPTLEVVEANDPAAGAFARGVFVMLAVAATALAGLVFSWLRVKGNGIGAPWALHTVINALALLAAALAHARV